MAQARIDRPAPPWSNEPPDYAPNPEPLDFEAVLHHVDTQIFGNTGIVTYYATGPTNYPDGTALTGTFRATIVAVRQGNQWRWAHLHLSEQKTEPE